MNHLIMILENIPTFNNITKKIIRKSLVNTTGNFNDNTRAGNFNVDYDGKTLIN